MKQLKNNPSLTLDCIKDKIKTPFNTLLIAPFLEKIATELFQHFITNIFHFELNGKKLTIEEAMEKNLFDFKVVVETKLKDTEWVLITEDEIYYSKGDNSN